MFASAWLWWVILNLGGQNWKRWSSSSDEELEDGKQPRAECLHQLFYFPVQQYFCLAVCVRVCVLAKVTYVMTVLITWECLSQLHAF